MSNIIEFSVCLHSQHFWFHFFMLICLKYWAIKQVIMSWILHCFCFRSSYFPIKTNTFFLFLSPWNSMLRTITSIHLIICTGVTQKYGMEFLEAMLQVWKMQWESTCLIYLKNNQIYSMNWYTTRNCTFLLNFSFLVAFILFQYRDFINTEILVDAKWVFCWKFARNF